MIQIYEDDCAEILTPMETVNRMLDEGFFEGDEVERFLSATLECGCDLEVSYIDGDGNENALMIHPSDLRDWLNFGYCMWGVRNGEWVLVCFE